MVGVVGVAGMVGALGLQACSAFEAKPPPPQPVFIRVTSDPGRALPGASVVYQGRAVSTTDVQGLAKLTLRGTEGEVFNVVIQCPAGYQSPAAPLPITLRRLADPTKIPEYAAQCPPTIRTMVVAVRADGGPNLPILYLGREVARTDEAGAAHVLVQIKPDEQFDLVLGTGERGSERLRPQNPTATFRAKATDDVVTFDAKFVTEGGEAPVRRSVGHAPKPAPAAPSGPIRLDSLKDPKHPG